MKIILVAIMLLAGSTAGMPAAAEQVYKCVDGKGRASYQSAPCAPTHTVTRTWDAAPEAPPTNAELWRQYHAKKRGQQESAYLRSLAGRGSTASGASIGTTQSGDSCAAAKQHRQATLNAVGLNRTYDLLQRLDAMVNAACK
ncbi:DUF4124 domain-containing protein [Pseudoxanthomonas gei]|nr:DUF4124 domain-containing protein [Pseudoxanthomonas gei]